MATQSHTLCLNLLHSRRHHALVEPAHACLCCGWVHVACDVAPDECDDCGHATRAAAHCCYCRAVLTELEKKIARRNRRPVCVKCRQVEVDAGDVVVAIARFGP